VGRYIWRSNNSKCNFRQAAPSFLRDFYKRTFIQIAVKNSIF